VLGGGRVARLVRRNGRILRNADEDGVQLNDFHMLNSSGMCRVGQWKTRGPSGRPAGHLQSRRLRIAGLITRMRGMTAPLVDVVMGSRCDWGVMAHASKTLDTLGVPHEVRILSAHRTPDALFEYMAAAEQRGVEVFIAAAGGAAHLAGVVAAKTLRPVLGVPMESKLQGIDSLVSVGEVPAGLPGGALGGGQGGGGQPRRGGGRGPGGREV